jgi:hypothetical protein
MIFVGKAILFEMVDVLLARSKEAGTFILFPENIASFSVNQSHFALSKQNPLFASLS